MTTTLVMATTNWCGFWVDGVNSVYLRLGNTPSVFVPTASPPPVLTESLDVSPEDLLKASLPWSGMELRSDETARSHLDRYADYSAAGKRVEIPIMAPPKYYGSGDLDQDRNVELTMDNWVNVVEAPTLPEGGGPTMYSTHQKPLGYYRNPYTVPLISFLETESTSSHSATSAASIRSATSLRTYWGAVSEKGTVFL